MSTKLTESDGGNETAFDQPNRWTGSSDSSKKKSATIAIAKKSFLDVVMIRMVQLG